MKYVMQRHSIMNECLVVAALLFLLSGYSTDARAVTSESIGDVDFMQTNTQAFDPYTINPSATQQAWMGEHYERMMVWSPYFDTRLSWYPNAWAYVNLYAIHVTDSLATQHPELIMRDANGNKLYVPWNCSNGTCPQWAGDFSNPEFREYKIEQMAQLVDKGYLGLWIDDVNLTWRASDGYERPVVPVAHDTGREMTVDDWRNYVATFTEEIRAAFPNVEIAHNAIWFSDTFNYANPYINRQIDAADYINLERGGNDTGLVGGNGPWGYETFLEYIDYVHSRGRGVVLYDYGATDAEREYGLATWFLIAVGGDYMGSNQVDGSAPDNWWPGYDLNLGEPLSSRYAWGSLLRRDFECGVVLLNQPDMATQTVSAASGTFVAVNGASVSSWSLPAKTAAILTKSCSLSALPSTALVLGGASTAVSFQNGVNGYAGTRDATINSASSNTNAGSSTSLTLDVVSSK